MSRSFYCSSLIRGDSLKFESKNTLILKSQKQVLVLYTFLQGIPQWLLILYNSKIIIILIPILNHLFISLVLGKLNQLTYSLKSNVFIIIIQEVTLLGRVLFFYYFFFFLQLFPFLLLFQNLIPGAKYRKSLATYKVPKRNIDLQEALPGKFWNNWVSVQDV